VIVTVADADPPGVTLTCALVLIHPDGTVPPTSNVFDGQLLLLLFVTVTV
jgi:hypothetical protein